MTIEIFDASLLIGLQTPALGGMVPAEPAEDQALRDAGFEAADAEGGVLLDRDRNAGESDLWLSPENDRE